MAQVPEDGAPAVPVVLAVLAAPAVRVAEAPATIDPRSGEGPLSSTR